MRAVLSIGSNMDDRYALLRTVVEEFAGQIVAASSIYSTPPWGVEDQDEFLNAVVIVDVDSSPLELLRRGQRLEEAACRRRLRHWGPRTLDVDVVTIYNDDGTQMRSTDPELTLPHPYAHERAFVLVPWGEADPEAELLGQKVAQRAAALGETFPVVGSL
ncbi:2-amino-4-hydroxy-6-hydroxymethyldihydropteridinediphosphokinase [Corynebacterium diphtheriae]|nr:2-amino-4-hydroxy-6-hydroxymethyldihydropteridinediphosphokinase [Corynebacterium diphtheriae]CAB0968181.1 2-amino-4-hydroxy-6-hydroxymethyldihydropteridinediphosphokinase [Corynebacterium diphtheriae]